MQERVAALERELAADRAGGRADGRRAARLRGAGGRDPDRAARRRRGRHGGRGRRAAAARPGAATPSSSCRRVAERLELALAESDDSSAPSRPSRSARSRSPRCARASSAWSAGASSSARSTRWRRRSTPRRVAHVEEMEGRRADLETALRELRALIRDTDRQIQETFEETFAAAARNFEELVGDVFPGGSGRLRLVSEEQPARGVLGGQSTGESGGEAATAAARRGRRRAADGRASRRPRRPPRPRPSARSSTRKTCSASRSRSRRRASRRKRLSLLSGGEKSMTALAFLFAVFLARPCPFYILDEVEAALDDLNLDRFLALLRRYCRPRAVHRDHPPEAHDGGRRLAVRRLDGRRRRLEGALAPPARASSRRCRGARGSPRSPCSGAGCDRSARRRGARLERSVHHRRTRTAGEPRPEEPRRRDAAGLFRRLRESMARRARRSAAEVQATLFGVLDEHTWERLEEALIMADVGASTTASVVGTLEAEVAEGAARGRRGAQRAPDRAAVADGPRRRGAHRPAQPQPTVIMAVGVNGTGKTTTIGKLAWHLRHELGRSRAARRRRHLPRGGERAARRLGPSARSARSSRARRARTPGPSPSRRSRGRAQTMSTW